MAYYRDDKLTIIVLRNINLAVPFSTQLRAARSTAIP